MFCDDAWVRARLLCTAFKLYGIVFVSTNGPPDVFILFCFVLFFFFILCFKRGIICRLEIT